MEATFQDKVEAIFDDANTVEITEGESPEGEYSHARVRGFDEDKLAEKRVQLLAQGIANEVNEYSLGLEIEAWQ